jgi:hypothetical protein
MWWLADVVVDARNAEATLERWTGRVERPLQPVLLPRAGALNRCARRPESAIMQSSQL